MKLLPPIPEALRLSASFLTLHEQDQLWRAALIAAESRGALQRLSSLFGKRIESLRNATVQAGERFGGVAWTDLMDRARDSVEDALWSAYDVASFGLDAMPDALRGKTSQNPTFHRLAAAASGAASGFVGLPGVLFDIPFTTTAILRTIATVARDSGEDLASDETRRACLEVLAFGGPSARADDEAELGYWATRLGVNHLTISLLMRSAASRLGVELSTKLLAQAVPVAGAFTGAALNYAFTDYYQNMARVHFSLRALDRRSGQPIAVRRVFAQAVEAARERRRIRRPKAKPGPVKFLPRAEEII
jgi:hypothetical protein